MPTYFAHTVRFIDEHKKHIFWLSLVLLVAVSFVYAYFLNQTVVLIVLRERMEEEIISKTAHIGELEFSYIALQNKLDLEQAYAMEFTEAPSATFIARVPTQPSLTVVETSRDAL